MVAFNIINRKVRNVNGIILILLGISIQSYAQLEKRQSFKHPTVHWEIINNDSAESVSELSLKNTGNTKFPASGWNIYFNSAVPGKVDTDTLNFKISHINGDFYKLSPSKTFKGILPNGTATIKLLTRPLKNFTDYTKGFYIVYENDPSKATPLTLENKLGTNNSNNAKEIANQVYHQNLVINKTNPIQSAPILPTPISYKYLTGNFNLTHNVKIVSPLIFRNESLYLGKELSKILTAKKGVVRKTSPQRIVLLEKKSIPLEGYELHVSSTGITIAASSTSGIFYGIQSLRNLFPAQVWKTKVPSINVRAISIKDAPRFGHRAFMMDISRNFQTKEQIIKTLDVLSLYKMNVMHLHFNDDEGWRIEIAGLPELTDLGAKRGHTLTELDRLIPAYGSGPSIANTAGSGYLTREDFIEILKYAKKRHITVIPEYETPGHARAAIKSMDARYHRLMKAGKKEAAEEYLLRDLNDKSVYQSVQNFNDNIINPAVPSVYNFIEKITDETIAMYKEAGAPLKTIHFGGDEVPNGVWEQSPMAKELLAKDSSIENIDELWQYFFSKVDAILKARNLYLSGWEEIGLRKMEIDGKKSMVLDTRFINKNYHADVWNNTSGNEDLAYKLANAGYKVVLTNVTNMYLDLAYNKSFQEPGQYWGGNVDVDKPFNFIPLDYYRNQKADKNGKLFPKNFYDDKEKLTKAGAANIIGLQAPLWSEIINSKQTFEYLLLPKLLGVAERSWATSPDWATETDSVKQVVLHQKAWGNFVNLIGKNEFIKLNHYAGGFNYRIPPAGYLVENNKVKANVLYPNLLIKYTEDGSEPTVNSTTYHAPIPYKANIKLKVFNAEGRGSATEQVHR